MTDHNNNKIGPDGSEEVTPGGHDPQRADPLEEDTLAGSTVSSMDPAGIDQAVAVAGELPGTNPFAEMVGEASLEAELRQLAAQNNGVQTNETYQIQTTTPAGGFLPAPTGPRTVPDLLACIGMSVKVTRMIEATGIPTGEVSTTGEEPVPTQTVITHRDTHGVTVDVLDGTPGSLPEPPSRTEIDDLYQVNTGFATDLLEDGGDEAISQLMKTYHLTSDIPLMEVDYNQLELDETGSGPEAMSGPNEEPREPVAAATPMELTTLLAPAKARTVETEAKTSFHRPEPREREEIIQIPNVGAFRRETGQPLWLRAYPYIKPESVPASRKQPQAYRGQDHYNPVWTYVHGTRRDRLKALVKQWNDAGSPTEDDWPTSKFEIRLYRGERQIIQEPQPWIGEVGLGVDYNRFEECDRLVMNAVKESCLLPRLEGGFDVATPSYLTVVLPGDKAMLMAREAIEIGAAFPYAQDVARYH